MEEQLALERLLMHNEALAWAFAGPHPQRGDQCSTTQFRATCSVSAACSLRQSSGTCCIRAGCMEPWQSQQQQQLGARAASQLEAASLGLAAHAPLLPLLTETTVRLQAQHRAHTAAGWLASAAEEAFGDAHLAELLFDEAAGQPAQDNAADDAHLAALLSQRECEQALLATRPCTGVQPAGLSHLEPRWEAASGDCAAQLGAADAPDWIPPLPPSLLSDQQQQAQQAQQAQHQQAQQQEKAVSDKPPKRGSQALLDPLTGHRRAGRPKKGPLRPAAVQAAALLDEINSTQPMSRFRRGRLRQRHSILAMEAQVEAKIAELALLSRENEALKLKDQALGVVVAVREQYAALLQQHTPAAQDRSAAADAARAMSACAAASAASSRAASGSGLGGCCGGGSGSSASSARACSSSWSFDNGGSGKSAGQLQVLLLQQQFRLADEAAVDSPLRSTPGAWHAAGAAGPGSCFLFAGNLLSHTAGALVQCASECSAAAANSTSSSSPRPRTAAWEQLLRERLAQLAPAPERRVPLTAEQCRAMGEHELLGLWQGHVHTCAQLLLDLEQAVPGAVEEAATTQLAAYMADAGFSLAKAAAVNPTAVVRASLLDSASGQYTLPFAEPQACADVLAGLGLSEQQQQLLLAVFQLCARDLVTIGRRRRSLLAQLQAVAAGEQQRPGGAPHLSPGEALSAIGSLAGAEALTTFHAMTAFVDVICSPVQAARFAVLNHPRPVQVTPMALELATSLGWALEMPPAQPQPAAAAPAAVANSQGDLAQLGSSQAATARRGKPGGHACPPHAPQEPCCERLQPNQVVWEIVSGREASVDVARLAARLISPSA